MGIEITVTEDRAQWDILTVRLRSAGGARIEAGLFSAKQAFKGALAETGSADGRNPARPWASKTGDDSIAVIGGVARQSVLKIIVNGVEPKAAYEPVGEFVADRLIDTIKSGQVPGPPNARSTKRAKHHGQVLVGKLTDRKKRDPHMVDSIKHRVRVRKAAKK